MGAIAPVLTSATAPTLGNTLAPLLVGTAVQLFESSQRASQQRTQQELAVNQLQQKQSLQKQQLESENALRREELALTAQQDEDNRKAALKRAVARQRALFGASGVGNATNGSNGAVLLGLFDETEVELEARESLDALRSRALDLSESNTRSLNVLQRTQLEEKNKINRIRLF